MDPKWSLEERELDRGKDICRAYIPLSFIAAKLIILHPTKMIDVC